MTLPLHCILLVDDDEATNFLSNLILEEKQAASHVRTTKNGLAALKYLKESIELDDNNATPYPDLILLDINMPAMDGWEFIEHFKELDHGKNKTPVIVMLSTSINPDDRARALRQPEISSFEYKPLTTEMVDSIIERFFT